jgi:hypothetical protein
VTAVTVKFVFIKANDDMMIIMLFFLAAILMMLQVIFFTWIFGKYFLQEPYHATSKVCLED